MNSKHEYKAFFFSFEHYFCRAGYQTLRRLIAITLKSKVKDVCKWTLRRFTLLLTQTVRRNWKSTGTRTHPEQVVTIKSDTYLKKNNHNKTCISAWPWTVSQHHVYGRSNRLLWWAAPSPSHNVSGDEVLISPRVIKASQLVNVLLAFLLESVKIAVI